MRRAYKFRLRPTRGQHVRLQSCLDAHRELYNAALQERRDAYERQVRRSPLYFGPGRPRMSVRYGTQSAQLKEIRQCRPEIGVWSFSSQQATLRRLNRAFEAFFRRVCAGETPGYPRFKAAHRFHSVEWPKDGDGCGWHPETKRIYLQGVGNVKVTVHRPVEGRVKTIQVRREGRRWVLVLSCDDVPAKPKEPTGAVVGIDVGVTSFATTSDGEHIKNPRYSRAGSEKLARSQQALARKQRGSANRQRARETVASRHRKVANQRRDFHHKTAKALVAEYDMIVVENLKITNMVGRAKPRPDPEDPGGFLPNGGSAKSGLNRSISDAGWGAFVCLLHAKAEEAGRTVVDVDPRHTSDRCEACGHQAKENRVSQAEFRCRGCGHQAHADEHAARNILRAGLAHLAADKAT
ncbi:MAG TPA: transposase [Acidimicrobiales bacterium]|nr:transposase [Acidimicrobiales bacterium]